MASPHLLFLWTVNLQVETIFLQLKNAEQHVEERIPNLTLISLILRMMRLVQISKEGTQNKL